MPGRVVIVTGGAMGIGRHIAHTFAEDGDNVVIADIDEKGLANVQSELKNLGSDALAVRTDVADEDAVRKMVDQVVSRFGRIDVLVNDAAIVPHFQWGNNPRWPRVRDMQKAQWNRVMDTNLGGTFLCTKYVLPQMEQQRSGHVLNLFGGGQGDGACAYVVSKHAIATFTKFVAEEERPWDVFVAVLGPGGTIATENAPEEARRRMPGPDVGGNRFVVASKAAMGFSGHLLDVKDGRIVIVS